MQRGVYGTGIPRCAISLNAILLRSIPSNGNWVRTIICQCLCFFWVGGFLRPDFTGYMTRVLKCLDSTCILGFLYFKNKTAATSACLLEHDHNKRLVQT